MTSLPLDNKNGCPDKYHKRASYTSKLGHHVRARCVKSQTVYAETRKRFTQRVLAKQSSRLRSTGHQSTRRLQCPDGQIERKGYVRKFDTSILKKGYTVKRIKGQAYRIYPAKSTVYVKSACVKDRGLPGKLDPGKGFGPLRKGELKKHGYVYNATEDIRHDALKKAVEEFGALGVYHKLDAIAKLSKRTAPEASKIFRKDREWINTHYKLKAL